MRTLMTRTFLGLQRGFQLKVRKSRGQNTVEYLLMLTVVVAVVLLAGGLMKKMMPGLFNSISGMISGAAGSLGSTGG